MPAMYIDETKILVRNSQSPLIRAGIGNLLLFIVALSILALILMPTEVPNTIRSIPIICASLALLLYRCIVSRITDSGEFVIIQTPVDNRKINKFQINKIEYDIAGFSRGHMAFMIWFSVHLKGSFTPKLFIIVAPSTAPFTSKEMSDLKSTLMKMLTVNK